MSPIWSDAAGRWLDIEPITLAASAARTASGQGVAMLAGDRASASMLLSVTAASGTSPTLNTSVETRHDAADAWRSVGSFAQATGISAQRESFPGLDREVRVAWTIAGTTPSFTFTVVGEVK